MEVLWIFRLQNPSGNQQFRIYGHLQLILDCNLHNKISFLALTGLPLILFKFTANRHMLDMQNITGIT